MHWHCWMALAPEMWLCPSGVESAGPAQEIPRLSVRCRGHHNKQTKLTSLTEMGEKTTEMMREGPINN